MAVAVAAALRYDRALTVPVIPARAPCIAPSRPMAELARRPRSLAHPSQQCQAPTGYRVAVPVEYSELQMVWPPSLFVSEATALLEYDLVDEESMGWLLAEAFTGDRAYRLFVELRRARLWGVFGSTLENLNAATRGQTIAEQARPVDPAGDLVRRLIRDAHVLPRYQPTRYYSQRRHQPQPEDRLTSAALRTGFAGAVARLDAAGYFEDAFGSTCVDSRDQNPDREGQRWLAEAVGREAELWPLARAGESVDNELTWDDELLFDVIEALHDVVARPRRRTWHEHGQEWDYSDFARRPGQAVYRWRVNGLLARSEVDLRVADGGEDEGCLVHAAGDERDSLLQLVLATPDARDREAIQHAVALIRGRHAATREEKRSAVVALARVLESRRPLIEAALTRKDAGALFQIANEFDLRHRGARGTGREQREDYDDAFLDWVYWWYLATVELTDRLLALEATPHRR